MIERRTITDNEVLWMEEMRRMDKNVDLTTIEVQKKELRIRRLHVSALNASQRLVLAYQKGDDAFSLFMVGAFESWNKKNCPEQTSSMQIPMDATVAEYFNSDFAQKISLLVKKSISNPGDSFTYQIERDNNTILLSNADLMLGILSYSFSDVRRGLF